MAERPKRYVIHTITGSMHITPAVRYVQDYDSPVPTFSFYAADDTEVFVAVGRDLCIQPLFEDASL